MSYRLALVAGLAVSLLVVLLAAPVGAQGFPPPPPPTTYYGTASGATPGALVTAYVVNGGSQAKCGEGTTLLNQSTVVYVVNVAAESGQDPGCGAAGRQVKLTFKLTSEPVARPATTLAQWVSITQPPYDPVLFNVTLGDPPPIVRQAAVPGVARNP